MELFLRNLLLDESNPLYIRTLHISGAFVNDTESDIGEKKPDIGEKKSDIDGPKSDIQELMPDFEAI